MKHKRRKLYHRYEELNRAYDKCKDAAQELNSANEVLNFRRKGLFEKKWDFLDTHSMFDDNYTSAETLFHEIDEESAIGLSDHCYSSPSESEEEVHYGANAKERHSPSSIHCVSIYEVEIVVGIHSHESHNDLSEEDGRCYQCYRPKELFYG